jgi:hypothetical protein
MKKRLKSPRVLRLTVDEKLSEDLIRLLVCPLAAGITEFYDRTGEWGAESEVLVGPATFAGVMGIPDDKASAYPWEKLKEGQVFLSGRFAVLGHEKEPDKFTAGSKTRNFLRIDDLVRKRIKRLYFDALEGRKAPCPPTR